MKPSREILEFQIEQLNMLVDKMLKHSQDLALAIAPYAPNLASKEIDIIKNIEKAKTQLLNPPD